MCVCVCVCLVVYISVEGIYVWWFGVWGMGGMEGMGHVSGFFNRYFVHTAPITTINMATINDDNK